MAFPHRLAMAGGLTDTASADRPNSLHLHRAQSLPTSGPEVPRMPPRPRRPLLSRLPVWFWVVVLCAMMGWLLFRLRHVLF